MDNSSSDGALSQAIGVAPTSALSRDQPERALRFEQQRKRCRYILWLERGAAREKLRQALLVCGIEAQIGAVPGGAEDLHRAGGKLREIRVLILLLEDLRRDGVHQETPGDRS